VWQLVLSQATLKLKVSLPNLIHSSLLLLLFVSRYASIVISMIDNISKFPDPLYVFLKGTNDFWFPILSLEFAALVRVVSFNKLSPFLCDFSFQEVMGSNLRLCTIAGMLDW
jgi:hypothetical protein